MELTDRLKIAVSKSGMTQTAIAEKSGTNPQYLNQVLNGRNNPSLALLDKLADALQVNLHWLIRGEGEPNLDATNKSNSEVKVSMEDILLERIKALEKQNELKDELLFLYRKQLGEAVQNVRQAV